MLLVQILLLSFFCKCEDESAPNDDDFWDKLSDDDIVVEDHVKGNLYDKARFNLPIRRRMKLYPHVQKTVKYLHGRQNMEFIYESKVPTLIFLDSDDVTVEKIDISKMSKDDIISLLALRGFKDIEDEPMPQPEKPGQNQGQQENETASSNQTLNTDETNKTAANQENQTNTNQTNSNEL